MTTFYLDPEGGSDAADGTTFANRWKTITSGATAARTAAGDTIRVKKSPDPTSLGISATWTAGSTDVTLASALTATVSDCNTAWTASANVTQAQSTTRKEGSNSQSFALDAAFTTGKAAYFALSSTDFSAYQQISFWIHQTSGTTAPASQVRLCLCSDTTGDTIVNSIPIPLLAQNGLWHSFTVNYGAALGASIQSVAFYVDTDSGAQTFLLDCIIACKAPGADALSLSSLISPANDNSLPWFPIRSIIGTTVVLDNYRSGGPSATNSQLYPYSTVTQTSYKREPLFCNSTTAFGSVQEGGTGPSARITFSGGWNDTDMSTQTGESYISIVRCVGSYIFTLSSMPYVTFDRISGVYGGVDNSNQAAYGTIVNAECFIAAAVSILASGQGSVYTVDYITGGSGQAVLLNAFGPNTVTVGAISGTLSAAVQVAGGFGQEVTVGTIRRIGNVGLNLSGGVGRVTVDEVSYCTNGVQITTFAGVVRNIATMTGNSANYFLSTVIGECTIDNCTGAPTLTPSSSGYYTRWQTYNRTAGDHRILTPFGLVQSEASVRHTASGLSWRLEPKAGTAISTSETPLWLSVSELAVAASVAITFKAWVRRSSTSLEMGIRARPDAVLGIDSGDVVWMTAGADTWEEITLNFTPTAAGVVTLDAVAYGTASTQYGYIDDITITAA